jgi:arylsulfatase A-like enzyme
MVRTMHISILRGILGLIIGSFVFPLHNSRAETPRPPNIIFILADDLGYAEVGCYGQKKIGTPCLDQMAKEGIRFTQFYCGKAVCAPSRCVLLTGKHAGHAFVRDNISIKPEGQAPIPAESVTIAKLLQKQGYVTAAIGRDGPAASGPAPEALARCHGRQLRSHGNGIWTFKNAWDGTRCLIPNG